MDTSMPEVKCIKNEQGYCVCPNCEFSEMEVISYSGVTDALPLHNRIMRCSKCNCECMCEGGAYIYIPQPIGGG
jgi:hypothetical protein